MRGAGRFRSALVALAVTLPVAKLDAQASGWAQQLNTAQQVLEAGEYSRARALFDEAFPLLGDGDAEGLAWAHFGRALATQRLSSTDSLGASSPDGMLLDYSLAATLDSRFAPAANFNSGLLLREQGLRRDALRAFLEASRGDHPSRFLFFLQAGREYAALGMPDSAAWGYERAIEENPADDEARQLLVDLYLRQGQDRRLVESAAEWSRDRRALAYLNNALVTLLHRADPPAAAGVAERAFLTLVENYSRMFFDSDYILRTGIYDLVQIPAVHPGLSAGVEGVTAAYRSHRAELLADRPRATAWWRETGPRRAVWSSLLRSRGDGRWLDGEMLSARGWYEHAVGLEGHAFAVEPWVDLGAVVMLAAVLVHDDIRDLEAVDEVVGAVEEWLDGLPDGGSPAERDAARDVVQAAAWGYTREGRYPEAVSLYERTLAIDPAFPVALTNLGFIYMASDIGRARAYFERAVELDPSDPQAANNLGFTHLIYGDFEGAATALARSRSLQDRLLTALNLGDAHRYSGNLALALQVHREALAGLMTRRDDEEYVSTEWRYNFMPLETGDEVTIRQSVLVEELGTKEGLVHYALALDHALLGDFAAADASFERARPLLDLSVFGCFLANKIDAAGAFLSLADTTAEWLGTRRRMLAAAGACLGFGRRVPSIRGPRLPPRT